MRPLSRPPPPASRLAASAAVLSSPGRDADVFPWCSAPPRSSSSSAPSLKTIWANPAAHNCLGSSLESCLDEAEQQTLKGAIAQLDLAQEDSSLSEARPDEALVRRNSSVAAGAGSVSTGTGTGGTGTEGSVASYFDEVAQSHELSVFRPDWNVHKTFYALVVRASLASPIPDVSS